MTEKSEKGIDFFEKILYNRVKTKIASGIPRGSGRRTQ